MFNLDGKIALVTGGAKGIGKGIAQTLTKAGATVIIGDIDITSAEQTATELGAMPILLNVCNQKQCAASIDEIVNKWGRLDILCSNAGIFPQKNLIDMTETDWDTTQDINLKSLFFMVQAALKPMSLQKKGRIIITSSITGPVTGFPGWSHYGASKAGQLGFMRSAALECAKDGITINAIMPGNILTEGLTEQGELYLNQMKSAIPTHTLGKPEDIGHAACFLASDEAGFITGQTIIVDGGQILPESPEAII